ncbi:MAG: tetratricopeptide repeat protein [Candidatus Saccharibacteria bacterium]
MSKISLFIIFIFILSTTFAQKAKVNSALLDKEAGKLEQALTSIEEAVNPANAKSESSIAWAHTWEVRGEIYQAIYKSKEDKFKKLHADPLLEALKSYQKATELDEKGKLANALKIKMQLLVNDLSEQAINAFNVPDYPKAFASFEQILAIQDMPLYKEATSNVVDTAVIFNAGLAAFKAEQYDKAIELYKKATAYKYNGSRTYELLIASYLGKKDTTGAVQAMNEGLNNYPDNKDILVQLVEIYRHRKMVNEALKYIDLAIAKDPKNESFHWVKGTLLDRSGNTEEAKKCYERAIEINKDYMDAYFNLGIIYYNNGVKQTDTANAIPGNETARYETEKAKADEEFKKALPYLEKAYAINNSDRMTLESLKNIYYRLQMMDKHASIVEKMKSIQ